MLSGLQVPLTDGVKSRGLQVTVECGAMVPRAPKLADTWFCANRESGSSLLDQGLLPFMPTKLRNQRVDLLVIGKGVTHPSQPE